MDSDWIDANALMFTFHIQEQLLKQSDIGYNEHEPTMSIPTKIGKSFPVSHQWFKDSWFLSEIV